VKPTETVAALGGWHEPYIDADSIDRDLAAAYLSLPYGNGSAKFAEPGYFANVRRFAPEFDFIADQLPRHGLLLDVGADGTWSTARLAARGLTCVALDITNHLLLGELYHTVFPPYARINADMHAPVFRDGSFDIVTTFNALHHSKHLPLIATRIASTLKPGGVLALVEPYVQNAAQEIDFGVPQSAVGISENVHTVSQWNDTFREAGLSLVTFALSDSFNAVYRKTARAPSERDLLATDADGCLVNHYQAAIEVAPMTMSLRYPATATFVVRVTNNSAAGWATRGPCPVALGYHLSRVEGDSAHLIAFDNQRTPIRRFLPPGRTEPFEVTIALPARGTYDIEFDLVHETRTWFKERGGRTATARCYVS